VADKLELTLGWSYTSIPGVIVAEALEKTFPMPVGVVWWRFILKNTAIEILGCYVTVFYRRKGVMTYLHEQLFAAYPDVQKIVTEDGSKEGGKAFMLASGYKKAGPVWELLRKPVKKGK
jgi:hypothetical protein